MADRACMKEKGEYEERSMGEKGGDRKGKKGGEKNFQAGFEPGASAWQVIALTTVRQPKDSDHTYLYRKSQLS